MSKKQRRQQINEALASALEPPRRRPDPKSQDFLLEQFDDGRPLTSLPISNSLPNIDMQQTARSEQIEPDQQNSLPAVSSLLKEQPPAYQNSSLPNVDSQPENNRLLISGSLPNVEPWSAVQKTRGHSKLPNTILDGLLRILEPSEQAVYLQLWRLSWGFGKDICNIGLPRLATRANVSRGTVQNAVKKLISRGFIQKLELNIGYGKEQGTIYRLPMPDSLLEISSLSTAGSLPGSSPIKEDIKKKIDKKRLKGIIDQIRSIYVGAPLPLSELADRAKLECAKAGLAWDNDLFNELIPR